MAVFCAFAYAWCVYSESLAQYCQNGPALLRPPIDRRIFWEQLSGNENAKGIPQC